jgi:hypothetical protein
VWQPKVLLPVKIISSTLVRTGVMAFDGTNTRLIKELPNLNQAYAGLSCACYHNERYFIAVPEGTDTTPNQLYELILKRSMD